MKTPSAEKCFEDQRKAIQAITPKAAAEARRASPFMVMIAMTIPVTPVTSSPKIERPGERGIG